MCCVGWVLASKEQTAIVILFPSIYLRRSIAVPARDYLHCTLVSSRSSHGDSKDADGTFSHSFSSLFLFLSRPFTVPKLPGQKRFNPNNCYPESSFSGFISFSSHFSVLIHARQLAVHGQCSLTPFPRALEVSREAQIRIKINL